jgi:hypothetical protein
MQRQMQLAALLAGVIAGLVGLLSFLVVHALWIMPIWFILPVGLLVAVAGGLAVGWSYSEIQPNLPGRPWTAFIIMLLISLVLLPSLVLAELRQPMFNVSAAGVANLAMGIPEVVARFIGELLVPAALVGGLLGRWLGRSRRAGLATALAGFVFALGPGHNIPFIGGTHGVAKQLAMMAIIVGTAALALVESHAWLLRGKHQFVIDEINR